MKDLPPLHRLRQALALLLGVCFMGALGFRLLGRMDWLDSFYFAVITLVGFRDSVPVSAAIKVFTIFYLAMGLVMVTMAFSNLIALLLEGDLKGYFRERRMDKRLSTLKDHIIVCGLGKMGFQAAWELKQAGVPFVIVEVDEGKGKNQRMQQELILYGNAMSELVLERAGIRRAKGLISALTTDADNVLVTLTARQMMPDLPIVARSAKLGTERQLKAAGATHIVSPYEIGGRRMAALLLNADMMSFFDVVLSEEQMELGMERILISPNSRLAGISLRDARMRDTTGALVVGIQRGMESLKFNPTGHETFEAGDVVLVLARLKSGGTIHR